MMTSYFVAKAGGAEHTQALQMIVQTWYGNSSTKAQEFWYRHRRTEAEVKAAFGSSYVSPDLTEEAQELHSIVWSLLGNVKETKGPWIYAQIRELYDELAAEFRHP